MVAIGLAIVLLAATGCSSYGSSGSSTTPKTTTPTTTTSSSSAAIQVTAVNYAFVPATLTAKIGQKVTITVNNTGTVEHNFSISSLQVNLDIAKGATETVTFTPTQAASVQFFCEYHKDSNNMVGTLNVSSY